MSNKNEQPKGMPESLLRMIDENCGGYYFIMFTDENGSPQCHFKSDNETMQLGLIQHLKTTVEALETYEQIDQQALRQTVLENIGNKM